MPEPLAPIPFIHNAVKEGKTPTEAINEYRESGGAIRTQRFYKAFGEIAAEYAVRESLQTAPSSAVPEASEITQLETHKPGGFLARGGVIVSVRSIDPLTGNITESTQTNFGSVRMASLRTYEEILAELESKFGPEGQSGIERSTVLGSFVTAVNEMVPPTE